MTTTGEKHVYCASICAEERKPGKRQILDILKELVPEEQYAYIQNGLMPPAKRKQQQKNWHSFKKKVEGLLFTL